jgi:hypothetical protein
MKWDKNFHRNLKKHFDSLSDEEFISKLRESGFVIDKKKDCKVISLPLDDNDYELTTFVIGGFSQQHG